MKAAAGITDGMLAAHEAVEVALPAGSKRLSLTLPADTAAVLGEGTEAPGLGRLTRTPGGSADIAEGDADTLLLFGTGDGPAPFSLAIEPLTGPGGLVLAP